MGLRGWWAELRRKRAARVRVTWRTCEGCRRYLYQRGQIYPYFGDLPVNSVKAATVRDWLGALDEKKLSQNYKTVLFTVLSSIMDSAVEDNLITINPRRGKNIKRPTSPSSNIVVWPEERLRAVQGGLPDRFRIVCAVGAGCGLRQGEILGLSLDDADEDGTTLHVQRQIRVVGRTLVFGKYSEIV